METPQQHKFNRLKQVIALGSATLLLTGCSSVDMNKVEDSAIFSIECSDEYEPQITSVEYFIGEVVTVACVNEQDESSKPLGIQLQSSDEMIPGHSLVIGYEDRENFFDPGVEFTFNINPDEESMPAQVIMTGADLKYAEIRSS